MTASIAPPKTASTRLIQLVALVATSGLVLGITRVAPDFHGAAGLIASVGFLLLAGMLASELLELFKLPHLTGYLALGVLAGPYGLGVVDRVAVTQLEHVNTLALTLIALAGGVELRWKVLKNSWQGLVLAHIAQTGVLLVVMTAAFYLIAPKLGFLGGFSPLHLLAISVLWAVIAISRSPSATLAILSQTHARGPLARFALAFVMSSDIIVVILLSVVMSTVQPWFDANARLSASDLLVHGRAIIGSITIGTTLGLALAIYLRLLGKQVLLIVLGLAFVASEAIHHLSFEPLLTFLIAGFVVQNLSKQGPRLLKTVDRTGSVVFVLFFATAGAHLDVDLLKKLWPVALILCGTRIAATGVAHLLSARKAKDQVVRRWGVAPLVSQAGLTLGLSVMIERTFPDFGSGLRSLVIATVAINEVIGPIVFKFALDRAQESR